MKFKDKLARLSGFERSRAEPSRVEELPTEAPVLLRAHRDAYTEEEQASEPSSLRARRADAFGEERVQPEEAQGAFERGRTLRALRERLEGMQRRDASEPRARLEARVDDDEHAYLERAQRDGERVFSAAIVGDEPAPRVGAPPSSLPAELHETEHGPLCRAITLHDEDHRHGQAMVARALHAEGGEVAMLALDPLLESCDFARALYIDTETTGLAGGAGTLPFLIGMAWFEDQRLCVEQLFLPRPGLEGPLLARLAERIRQASAIVSYNGKSFDWPLLRTRFVLNRLAAPALPRHLDLLHCARRVYKARLGSVRLIHLEQAVLGFERVDDIPGELIPQTYFGFLRGVTSGSELKPILEHNRSDLIALPALLGEMVQRFRGEHARQDARDQLGFARVAARASAAERAIALAESAVEADLRGELSYAALYLVGELKLKQADHAGACAAFERALEASLHDGDRARAHLALAKLHERKTKDYARALFHAALTAACEGEDASERRCARLRQRMARVPPRGPCARAS